MSSGYCEHCNREIWADSEREDLCADCENELLREQCASLRARLEEAEHEIDRLRAAENAAFHAFVAGAKWWEYRSTGGTMWPSDLCEVEKEAKRHYPYAPHFLVIEAQKKLEAAERELERLRAVAEAAQALHDSWLPDWWAYSTHLREEKALVKALDDLAAYYAKAQEADRS